MSRSAAWRWIDGQRRRGRRLGRDDWLAEHAQAVMGCFMTKRLSIIVVEKDRERALTIVDGLREAGDMDIMVIGDEIGLARKIAERNPDLVLIDAGNPSRDAIEELTLASAPMQRPVAMFVDESDGALTRAAIEAGVSAYVVAGLTANRIKPVLDAAIARFHMMQKMRVELAETRRALEERKVIDRAKGIVMRAKGIGEDEAYALMRKAAMDQGKKVADVAQALVTAAELLK
jgi:response regulator NasT